MPIYVKQLETQLSKLISYQTEWVDAQISQQRTHLISRSKVWQTGVGGDWDLFYVINNFLTAFDEPLSNFAHISIPANLHILPTIMIVHILVKIH